MILKTLSNSCFLPILLDKKRKGDRYLIGGNKGAKVRKASFKDVFLIISLHWPSLFLSKIGVDVCKENCVKKGKGDNQSPGTNIVKTVKKTDDLSKDIDILDKDRGVDKLIISTKIPDIDGKTDNPDTSTDTLDKDNIDGGTDNSGKNIDTLDTNERAADPSKNINIANIDKDKKTDAGININKADADVDRGADNLGIKIADIDGRAAASNKARASFFSLPKMLFFISFSKLEIVSTSSLSSFVSSLFSVILLKQKPLFSKYLIDKICMFNFNKTLFLMDSMLMLSRFFARYS